MWPQDSQDGSLLIILPNLYLMLASYVVLTLKKGPTKECVSFTFEVNPGSTQLIKVDKTLTF
jgi:hypothetical protein